MAKASDRNLDSGLFYPGMRRWDGLNRRTNNWNTLNHVRYFADAFHLAEPC